MYSATAIHNHFEKGRTTRHKASKPREIPAAGRAFHRRIRAGEYNTLEKAPNPQPALNQPYPIAPACMMRSLSGAETTPCVSMAAMNSAQLVPTRMMRGRVFT